MPRFSDRPPDARGAKGYKAASPIWVQGSLRGEYIRKALNVHSWEAASELVRGWEASGTMGVVKPDLPTVPEAVTKFFADATARQLSKSTISKQKNVLEKRLLSWCSKEGIRLLKQLDVDALRRFRELGPTLRSRPRGTSSASATSLASAWMQVDPQESCKGCQATEDNPVPYAAI